MTIYEGLKDTKQGGFGGSMDIYVAYKFIKFLVLPFEDWEAFKLGVIDKDGKVLKKNRKSGAEKDNYTYFHRLVRNLKRLLMKVPGGKSKFASVAAAYFLVREEAIKQGADSEKLDEEFSAFCKGEFTLEEEMKISIAMKTQEILL